MHHPKPSLNWLWQVLLLFKCKSCCQPPDDSVLKWQAASALAWSSVHGVLGETGFPSWGICWHFTT